MKRAWTEDGVQVENDYLRARGHTQQPHPPIWVGGNSKQAIRRAVTLGDGGMPMFTPAKYAGRRRTAAIETIDDLEAGVTTLCARVPASTCAQHVARMVQFGVELMPVIGG